MKNKTNAEMCKAWRKRNRQKSRKIAADRYARRSYLDRMLHNLRHKAKQRGIVFSLTASDLVVPETCPVLGVPLAFSHPNSDYRPSVDRWNNNLGYTSENIRIISMRANRIKQDATAAELYAIAAYAAGL
jgi:hypothetical protein